MKTQLLTIGALTLSLVGTGCATKKYVVKTITPVEERVTAAEAKNVDQDKQIAAKGKDIEELGSELSKTKERLTDVDAKAVAAGNSANQAGQRADTAQRAADGAKTLAQQGNDKADAVKQDVQRAVTTFDGMNRYQMLKSETVLFGLGQSKLTDETKSQLDEMAQAVTGQDRYMIEVQGFTDKTGPLSVNDALSQARAAEVTRYLVNQHKLPVRSISAIGSGYASPVGDDKTLDGRKMNRRVEVRLFVPEVSSAAKALAQK